MTSTAWRSSLRRNSYEYFRDVPLRRLTFLLLAIFCLFGMVGFLIDVSELGRKSLVEVLVWTLFSGGMAVFYLLTLMLHSNSSSSSSSRLLIHPHASSIIQLHSSSQLPAATTTT